MYYRVGACNNCGECCRLFKNNQWTYCPHYDPDQTQHCQIYPQRPQSCRQFPRSPMDLERTPSCSYWFVDEHGNKIDGYMDKRVHLIHIGKVKT